MVAFDLILTGLEAPALLTFWIMRTDFLILYCNLAVPSSSPVWPRAKEGRHGAIDPENVGWSARRPYPDLGEDR
jgi:hypothetical protein